jgi:HlyD family secretion protein
VKRRAKVLVLVLVAATLLAVIAWGIFRASRATVPREDDRAHAERATEQVEEPPVARLPTHREWVAGNATIEPAGREVGVSPAEPGKLEALHVQIGDRVTAGTVLGQLDHDVQEAQLEQAQAVLDESRAQLEATAEGVDPEQLEALRAELQAARAQAQRARTLYEQAQDLVRQGAAPRDEIDATQRELEAARANVAAAEARVTEASRGRSEDVTAAMSRVQAAAAAAQQAEAQLERTRIRAPRDGEILDIEVRVGEFVSATGTPLLWMGDTSTLHARVEIDERDIAAVAMGASAFVMADAYPEVRFPGRVIEVGRRLRRRAAFSENPADRVDIYILEVVVELEQAELLVPGLRVIGYLEHTSRTQTFARTCVESSVSDCRRSGPEPLRATR